MNKMSENSNSKAFKFSINAYTPDVLLGVIQKNYKKIEFSIDNYCKTNNVINSTITTQFTKRYGICPSVFLENLRIEDYLFMLWHPVIKFEEAGKRTGFGSARRARAALKKRLSLSPKACNKALIEDKGNTKVMQFYIKLLWNGNRPDELIGDIYEHFDRQIEYSSSLAKLIITK